MPSPFLANFTADVALTPSHPLCGGWIDPAKVIDEQLRATGTVLLGEDCSDLDGSALEPMLTSAGCWHFQASRKRRNHEARLRQCDSARSKS